jgi:hypothetical protein
MEGTSIAAIPLLTAIRRNILPRSYNAIAVRFYSCDSIASNRYGACFGYNRLVVRLMLQTSRYEVP